jgi:GH15 family glucan-1,4-alpha-glucosidase
MEMSDWLYGQSLRVMRDGQAMNGAFPASPSFSTYQYGWLRDGTFVAYALDVAGEHLAAANFYRWVHGAISNHFHKLAGLLLKKREGLSMEPNDFLHARYTIDGEEGREPWGNFQLDGYGTYLWGVAQHLDLSGDPIFLEEIRSSVEAVIGYLMEFWEKPNFDCWEENGDKVHPSTLAAIYGGLGAIERYVRDRRIDAVREEIRQHAERHAVSNGRFCKSVGDPAVDANLLWLAVPFGLFAPDDVRMVRTVEAIEAELVTGGVHRYPQDTFYGGGAWVLLTAWLGWYYALAGNTERARELLQWVEAQADEHGHLPEQVPEGLLHPEKEGEWIARWGEVARPLLWSHAMHVVLKRFLHGK